VELLRRTSRLHNIINHSLTVNKTAVVIFITGSHHITDPHSYRPHRCRLRIGLNVVPSLPLLTERQQHQSNRTGAENSSAIRLGFKIHLSKEKTKTVKIVSRDTSRKKIQVSRTPSLSAIQQYTYLVLQSFTSKQQQRKLSTTNCQLLGITTSKHGRSLSFQFKPKKLFKIVLGCLYT